MAATARLACRPRIAPGTVLLVSSIGLFNAGRVACARCGGSDREPPCRSERLHDRSAERESHRSDALAAASCTTPVALKILLAHQPRSAVAAIAAGFDLQLSGHTHGGQFLPWNFFVPLQQPSVAGLARMHTLWLYISRGTGCWGPPLRFMAPSEITRLRLVAG